MKMPSRARIMSVGMKRQHLERSRGSGGAR
jgi:hypothetical protein